MFRVLLNTRLFVGAVDLTTVMNKVGITADVEEKDVTTFLPEGDADSGYRKVQGGLFSSSLAMSGFWEAGDLSKVDDASFAALGTVVPTTIGPDSATVGDTAWVTSALETQYMLGGTVGDVAPWSVTAAGTGPTASGVFLHSPGTARTSTGDGTAVEHVAVAAGQKLYATLHVVEASGTSPSLTVTIESDATNDFTGSETTRVTFTEATGITSEAISIAGAITDTWYRVTHTISGTNPSFKYVCAIGVQ